MATNSKLKAKGKYKDLLKKASEPQTGGEIWRPEKEGQNICGEVISLKESEKGKWGPQTVMVLLTESGARTIFCNSVLKRQVEEQEVKVGDDVAIVYQGEVKTGKGRPCRIFGLAKA